VKNRAGMISLPCLAGGRLLAAGAGTVADASGVWMLAHHQVHQRNATRMTKSNMVVSEM
jgi:hypothetical protein